MATLKDRRATSRRQDGDPRQGDRRCLRSDRRHQGRVIDDPRKCKFDPSVCCARPARIQHLLHGEAGAGGARHPDRRAHALGRARASAARPGRGRRPGGWAAWTPLGAVHRAALARCGRLLPLPGVQNPAYDPMSFNFGSDLLFSLHAVGPLLDAIDPDLRPLHRRGAKLIVYTASVTPTSRAQLDQLLRERGGVHGAPER